MLRSCEKSISREKTSSSIENSSVSVVLHGNTKTVTAPYYPISYLLSVSGRLREVQNKRKFQTFFYYSLMTINNIIIRIVNTEKSHRPHTMADHLKKYKYNTKNAK